MGKIEVLQGSVRTLCVLSFPTILSNPSNMSSSSFRRLVAAWSDGTSMSDMYHMILEFLQSVSPVEYPDICWLVGEWLERAYSGDETNDLVEEFMYGDRYVPIHKAFS